MTIKKKTPTKKTAAASVSRVHRANSKPTTIIHTMTPYDIDNHISKTLRAKAQRSRKLTAPQKSRLSNMLVYDTEAAAGKAIRDLEKANTALSKVLLATTEAIEHYSEGERKSDPLVRAHADIALLGRLTLEKFGAKSKKAK